MNRYHYLMRSTAIASGLLIGAEVNAAKDLSWEKADLHEVAIMMSEPMMRVDGSYHELLDAYYLKPVYGANNTVMAPLEDILDELNGFYVTNGNQVKIELNGRIVEMSLGSQIALVNENTVEMPITPQKFDDALYLPFKFVFEQLGAKYSWNKKRERAVATLLRPKGSMFKSEKGPISLKTIYKKDDGWFVSAEAKQVAEAMLRNQNTDGGWFKVGSSASLAQVYNRDTFPMYRQKSTIDNDATYVQITTLAKVYGHTQDERYKESALRGIEYLINGQLNNGGWPQFFPETRGYHKHITFNDDAISNTLTVLRDVASQKGGYKFISDTMASAAKEAVEKGIALILDRQVVVNGKKTGWCAQYHYQTLECEKGRSYELAAISGGESVKVVKFLMSIENPSQDVINAVHDAVAFLQSQSIKDKKLVKVKDPTLEFGVDRVVIDKKGAVSWPRFIDSTTLEPLFSNRQGDRLNRFDDISYERSVKYSWLVTSPNKLINELYPKWQKNYASTMHVSL
ncbi:pectate lyase [Marinomonas balearica]|uniref:PelA/Pel-15E family pectate lyase n=1 Tax=Marinomonas balearica TaxID=491947 RepID=A0A4R6M3U1_9GAMM|nr:pectate lyase [Marinomonas balearica]TDO95968.1 PelA/Pel-15E family pectate lyase [Marinomonas balearica]